MESIFFGWKTSVLGEVLVKSIPILGGVFFWGGWIVKQQDGGVVATKMV